jgi:hypothetical protein
MLRDLAQDCPNFLFHADMGGMKTNIRTARKSKALGMERGVPKLFLFLPGIAPTKPVLLIWQM